MAPYWSHRRQIIGEQAGGTANAWVVSAGAAAVRSRAVSDGTVSDGTEGLPEPQDEAEDAATAGEDYEGSWFAVRCVFHAVPTKAGGPSDLAPGEHAYEERITLWYSASADEAIELAEEDADQYASAVGAEYTGLAQSYWLEDEPGQGAVAFSLMRKSQLQPDAYIDAFFDTGLEYEETLDE